ncbi:MAG: hypothetical protein BECKG1743D_GA0114223_101705, partial [Candidatus Kentron sp. G]
QAQDSSLTHSTLQLRATMSAIRHPCLIMGQCPSNFEGRNTLRVEYGARESCSLSECTPGAPIPPYEGPPIFWPVPIHLSPNKEIRPFTTDDVIHPGITNAGRILHLEEEGNIHAIIVLLSGSLSISRFAIEKSRGRIEDR